MNRTLRRAIGFAATLTVGAALVVAVPTMASATVALPAPNEVDGQAFDNGTNGSYGMQIVDPPDSTHDASVVLVGYLATLYDGASFAHTVSTTTTDSPDNITFDFDNLTYGQAYQGSVEAIYLVDGTTTEYSAETDADSDTPLQDAPGPTNLKASAVKSGEIKVSWSQPALTSVQSPVEDYEIIGFQEDSSVSEVKVVEAEASSTARSYTLHGLTNGVVYDIVVTSDLLNQDSSFGNSDVEVRSIGAPGAPSHLKATFHSGGKAKLTWHGAKSTKAGPVTGYHVYVGGKLVKTLSSSARSYTAAHEHKGKTYAFTVKAYNKVGSSKGATTTKKRTTS